MTPERWKQIDHLLEAALEWEPDQWSAFLEENCAGDAELRREVESLLTAHMQAEDFIEAPPAQAAAELLEESRSESLAGQQIGPYRVTAPLAKGGMGEVYRALDTRLGREVAIKLMPAAFSSDQDRLRRFEQEARAAGMLNHPNVLTIYDIGAHGGAPYIVSELLTGETLRERLPGAPLPLRRVVDYALQVARGLAAAHEAGIVHRDLKPENLFVTKDGRMKILDFGLAKLKPAPAGINTNVSIQLLGTAPGIVMGTVGYMAPEQVRAEEEVDHRADIFAFGAILYEMLTGKRAFQGDSAVEVLNAILKEEPTEISESKREVPPALVRVVRHCLEKSREERFQSMADVAFYLEALPAAADRETPAAERARPRGRVRRWWAVAAVVAVIIALAAALTLWRVLRPDEVWENPLANAHIERVTDFPGTETDAAVSPDGKFHRVPLRPGRDLRRLGQPSRERDVREPDEGAVPRTSRRGAHRRILGRRVECLAAGQQQGFDRQGHPRPLAHADARRGSPAFSRTGGARGVVPGRPEDRLSRGRARRPDLRGRPRRQ